MAAALEGRVRLLVFDNCEHVLDAAADLIDGILAHSACQLALEEGSCPRPGVNDDGRRFLRDRPKSTKEGLRPCLFEYRPLRRFAAGSMPCLMVRGIWSRCLRRSPGWARS